MNASQKEQTVEMLLVEDNPADVALAQMSLKETKLAHNLHVTRDGDAALAFLRRLPPYAAAPRPALVLLDLNLPRKDGREVLAEIKGDKELAEIPVVILTTSNADRDILHAYKMHANSYITKPTGFDKWVDSFRSFHDFWFKTAKLPSSVKRS